MAFFKKKEKKEEIPRLPDIPPLPELPEFPEMKENEIESEELPQLPSFPSGNLGDQFSQNTIKEAITGKKEVKGFNADEFAEEDMQMMRKPLIRETLERQMPKIQKTKETGPIFIRIDKFEEGSQTFDEVQRRISEMENMFNEVKKIKEREDKELESWENEIKQIKEKIDSIDKNIFSNVE